MHCLFSITLDMSLSRLPGVGDGQGSLACCSPWGHKESDATELNYNSGSRMKGILAAMAQESIKADC